MTRDRRRGVISINHCQVSAIRPLITGCREQGRLSDESRPFSEWTYSEVRSRGGEKRKRKRKREREFWPPGRILWIGFSALG